MKGKVNERNVSFLIDSRASVSAVHTTLVPESCVKEQPVLQGATMSANGTHLDVVCQATLLVTLENFQVQQQFIVVKDLSVDCLLGADFLVAHEVVIDCGAGKLRVGGAEGHSMQLVPHEHASPNASISAAHMVEVPWRSILLIQGRVNFAITGLGDGLVEALGRPDKPNRLLLDRSLVIPSHSNEVTLQVTNVGPHPIKLFKGSTLGTLIPRNQVMAVADSKTLISATEFEAIWPPQININDKLTPGQKDRLRKVLERFADLFDQNQLGRTSVAKHTICTQGPPIKQPMRRLPVCCKDVVQQEVSKMLENGVIR